MAKLGLALQDYFPSHYRMFRRNRFAYRGRVYRNHNRLLGRFAGTDGIKTGYTRASGFNIATSVRRDGRHVVGVVIGRKSGRIRETQMRRLLAKYLPRASTIRTRRHLAPPHKLVAPKLVARPRMVPRQRASTYRRAHTAATLSSNPGAVGGETLIRGRMIASRPAVPSPAVRQPSTFGDQLARMRADRLQPSRQWPSPAVAVSGRPLPRAATHHVQIGAYSSEADARRALEIARTKARGLLRGYQPVSLRHQTASRAVFRARFAGFDARQATETCSRLRSVRVDCFVTRSN
jgi:D-alanyl-D-alanine carboxypeptidase